MAENPIGAVLVIGDGIGAVQAALDLAASKQVYLLSSHPLLTGRPTFDAAYPTNDCELCFLGPELLALRHHPRIELLGHRTLVSLSGEAGRFTATLGPPEEPLTRQVGAVILAPTPKLYDPAAKEEWGYGRYRNVVTSMDFDRILAEKGRVAWLQCVGSRDREHNYCSATCCLEATKKAMMALDSQPEARHHIFMMDMRAFGKGYLDYYNRARADYGLAYTRCRLGAVTEDAESGELILRYETETGELRDERFDLLVLSVGMELQAEAAQMAQRLGIDLNEHGFVATDDYSPVETARPGVFVAGPISMPRDTHDTVTQAGAAVAQAQALLRDAADVAPALQAYPPEREVSDETPRIGVFFGQSREGICPPLDISALTELAASWPNVVHASNDLHMAPHEWAAHVAQQMADQEIDRLVVATGTPLTYDDLYRDLARRAGLNPNLVTLVNLREQCAWPHLREPERAQRKAADLVRMAVARAAYLLPLPAITQDMTARALVIGGGIAGLTATWELAQQGHAVTLVERQPELGGNVRRIQHDLDGKPFQPYLTALIEQVTNHPLVDVLTDAELTAQTGAVGRFQSTIRTLDGPQMVEHGVTIVATGGNQYEGPDYGLGQSPQVITQFDLEAMVEERQPEALNAHEIVMIQCVGTGTQYCSRVCCSVAIKHALQLKALNPDVTIYILYRDVRMYGFREAYYTAAREAGIVFLRYDDDNLPQVSLEDNLAVSIHDYLLDRDITFHPDYLVLSEGIVPADGQTALADLLHLRINAFGFLIESHPKLRPVDMANEGVFVCGLAHAPKAIVECITQAQAAAARASQLLSAPTVALRREIAVVDQDKCTGCLTCVRICPYDVPVIDDSVMGVGEIVGAAYIEPTACKGCGLCAGECPAKAIQLQHYRDEQILAEIEALRLPAQGAEVS